jgi:transcriptional regulator with XRE-family HTH domain
MEDVRIGIWVRTARLRAGWRQSDLAAMAGVSKSSVSRLERGELGSMTLRQCRRIAACVGIELFLVPHSVRLGDLERQVDKRHASLVDAVVERVTEIGWAAETEYSFNRYGDRGSVDVLGWNEVQRALLIVGGEERAARSPGDAPSDRREAASGTRTRTSRARLEPGGRGRRARAPGPVHAALDRRPIPRHLRRVTAGPNR